MHQKLWKVVESETLLLCQSVSQISESPDDGFRISAAPGIENKTRVTIGIAVDNYACDARARSPSLTPDDSCLNDKSIGVKKNREGSGGTSTAFWTVLDQRIFLGLDEASTKYFGTL